MPMPIIPFFCVIEERLFCAPQERLTISSSRLRVDVFMMLVFYLFKSTAFFFTDKVFLLG